MCTIFKQEGAEKGLLCCKLIELSDLRINWHSNAKIDTNWGRACKCAKDSTEKVTWISKLYGQQLGNAFKSIDKMKCNPLETTPSLLPFLLVFLCCHCNSNCIHVFTDCTEFCINFNATLDQTDTTLSLSCYHKSADTSRPNKLLVINSLEKIFSTCQKLLWTKINDKWRSSWHC